MDPPRWFWAEGRFEAKRPLDRCHASEETLDVRSIVSLCGSAGRSRDWSAFVFLHGVSLGWLGDVCGLGIRRARC
jgi:hypothetical protein